MWSPHLAHQGPESHEAILWSIDNKTPHAGGDRSGGIGGGFIAHMQAFGGDGVRGTQRGGKHAGMRFRCADLAGEDDFSKKGPQAMPVEDGEQAA